MSLPSSKMTRRKQNTPKRLKSTDKSGNNQPNTQPVNSSHVNSNGCAGEGDGDEDEGDTTSDEESMVDKHSDSKLEQDARNQLFKSASVAVNAHHSAGNPRNETEISKELNGYRKTKDEYAQSSPDVGKHGEKIGKSFSSKNTEVEISGTSRLEARTQSWSSPKTGSTCGDKYKYSYKLGRHIVPSSSALALADLDPQMALVMSSMPLSMLSRATNSPSQQKLSTSYNPLTNPCQRDEQPLDLSKKSERSMSSLSPNSVMKKCTAASGSTTSATSTTSNGFSSLQSLQRRFGGEYPLELPHHQPSMTHKSAVAPHALPMSSDGPQRTGMSKPKPGPRSERAEKQDVNRALASSPMLKGSNSRHTSPLLADEPITEAGGKHTIHRCSCQKTFSTLYTLSLHLQETGHTPAASKTSSPMDYPKLVRGQDMWLNQESEQTRRILRCMQCGESFRSLPLLTVHMMQTQHYTKIVSSDHGRRSHKCSTYCDRELDRECIFKCKVCHEAFTDMEGLANHMIVSGHHKKQSSRQIPNPAAFSGDISCLTRQGRRKRLSPEDITAVSGTNPSTVASLLVHRQKQILSSHIEMNGFHSESKTKNESRSPESQPQRLVLCDSCGRHVESRDFDSHVRTCLKQRAEVIDALKNKLAIEEALLSRSESKLLRSGISLSPLSDHGKYLFTNTASAKKESPSEVHSSSHSLYEKINEVDPTGYPSQVKSEVSSPELDSNCASADSKSLPKNTEFCAKICDLIEVPLRKWYCSSEEPRHASSRGNNGNSDKRNESNESVQMSKTVLAERDHKPDKVVKQEDDDDDDDDDDQEMSVNNRSVSSPGVGEKRKLHDADDPRDGITCRRKRDKLSPDLIPETPASESLDFTSSALHKLDMFSRGLKFSPPRRNMAPESKLLQHHHHHPARISKKRDASLFIAKSPQPVPVSPLSQLKAHSPEPPKQDVTFDIIDPNAGSEAGESSSSALEAMESFIHKSFSAKSDICSSNLASMFSPLRNCFPLPVSLPGQNGVLPESSDRALSQFAKFTKFFRMVPGAASLSETPSTPSLDTIKPAHSPMSPPATLAAYETQHGTRHDKISHKKKAFAKPHSSASTIKVPHVNFPQELSLGAATTPLKLSSGKTADGVHSSKKYKYSSSISVSAMLDSVRNWHHSQRLAQPSGNILSENDRPEHAQGDSLIQSPADNDTSTKEPKKIFDLSLYHGNNESDADNDKTGAVEENNEKEYTDYVNKGRIHVSGRDKQCYEKHKNNSLYSYKQEHAPNSLSKSPVTVIKEEYRETDEIVSEVDEVKANVSHCTEIEGKQLFPNSSQSAESVSKDEEVDRTESVEDDNRNSRDGQFGSEMSEELPESKGSDKCEGVVPVEVKNKETVVKSPVSVYEKLCGKRSKLGLNASLKSGDDNRDDSCHSDVDTEDSEDSARMAECVAVKKSRALRDYRESELEAHSADNNVLDKNVYKTQGIQYMADVKIIKREGEVDNSLRLCFRETGKAVSTQSGDVANDCLDNEVMGLLEDPIENKSDSEDFISSMKHGTSLKCSVHGKKPISYKSENLLKQKAAECSDNTGAVSPDLNDDMRDKTPEHTEIVMEKKAAIVAKEATGKPKTSALDSLSSFVYSQPLTSEHPLDCLHRLLSTNELNHLPADQQRYASTAAAYRCLSPDLSQAQNLTLKGRGGGGGVSSGGCSSDENEEVDPAATEGGAVEGEIREYKCAACNRRFASKGSYRYHLSRCHLSSVKKYGIKEAFNMSPYVYLPLDHTAKFSKYYQMAHELANKGK